MMILDLFQRFIRRLRPSPREPAIDPVALPRCARVLAAARQIAIDGGHGRVSASHILLALLETDLVRATLVRTGADPRAVRDAVRRLMPPGAHRTELGDVPFDGSARAVLAQAAAEAREHGNEVNPLHLLAGILREPSLPAARALAECGCSLDELRRLASGAERGPGTRL